MIELLEVGLDDLNSELASGSQTAQDALLQPTLHFLSASSSTQRSASSF
jgi:hypothetical protein